MWLAYLPDLCDILVVLLQRTVTSPRRQQWRDTCIQIVCCLDDDVRYVAWIHVCITQTVDSTPDLRLERTTRAQRVLQLCCGGCQAQDWIVASVVETLEGVKICLVGQRMRCPDVLPQETSF